MKITVIYGKDNHPMDVAIRGLINCEKPEDFRRITELDFEDEVVEDTHGAIERAFFIMNYQDEEWNDRFRGVRARSMCSGDILIVDEGEPSQQNFICLMSGWKERPDLSQWFRLVK